MFSLQSEGDAGAPEGLPLGAGEVQLPAVRSCGAGPALLGQPPWGLSKAGCKGLAISF